MQTAASLLLIAEWYAWIGLGVGAAFILFGIDRFDENARGAYLFRALVFPGAVVIWPIVLWRWALREAGAEAWALRHRPPRRAHGGAAILLAIAIPLIIGTGIAVKQVWPAEIAPQKLSEAGE